MQFKTVKKTDKKRPRLVIYSQQKDKTFQVLTLRFKGL